MEEHLSRESAAGLPVLRTITQKEHPADQSHASKNGNRPKNIFQKQENSKRAKRCPLSTTIYHAITTNSPRFNHQKAPQNAKPPAKTHIPHKTFFPNLQAQNPSG
jgi:hypothetical protein